MRTCGSVRPDQSDVTGARPAKSEQPRVFLEPACLRRPQLTMGLLGPPGQILQVLHSPQCHLLLETGGPLPSDVFYREPMEAGSGAGRIRNPRAPGMKRCSRPGGLWARWAISQAGYSSVGRASDCRALQQSDGPWFDSGWPEVMGYFLCSEGDAMCAQSADPLRICSAGGFYWPLPEQHRGASAGCHDPTSMANAFGATKECVRVEWAKSPRRPPRMARARRARGRMTSSKLALGRRIAGWAQRFDA